MRTKHIHNLSILGIVAAAALALQGCWLFAAGAGAEAGYVASQEDRSVSQTMSDQRITTEVKSRLIADRDVPGLNINVDTYKGKVSLHGTVRDPAQAERAVAIAREVAGVQAVSTEIKVQS